MPESHNGQAHNESLATDTAAEPRKYSSVGLQQAYEFREDANKVRLAIMAATAESLDTEVSRARGLKDANSVWQASQDEARVCRGVGKPKSVTASNDPARKGNKGKRKPIEPVILPVLPDP